MILGHFWSPFVIFGQLWWFLVTFCYIWWFWSIMVILGHFFQFWSILVILGHFWSPFVILEHFWWFWSIVFIFNYSYQKSKMKTEGVGRKTIWRSRSSSSVFMSSVFSIDTPGCGTAHKAHFQKFLTDFLTITPSIIYCHIM